MKAAPTCTSSQLSFFCLRGPVLVVCLLCCVICISLWMDNASEEVSPLGATQLFSTADANHLTVSFDLAFTCGLGNHLYELAALAGVADSIGRRPAFYNNASYRHVLEHGSAYLPKLTSKFVVVPLSYREEKQVVFNRKCCVYDDPSRLKKLTDRHIHLSGLYFQSYKYFWHLENFIRNSFVLPNSAAAKARENFPTQNRGDFLICVHIRRGDFIRDFFHYTEDFYTKAVVILLIKKYSQHLPNLTFVFLGDDVPWAKEVFTTKFHHPRFKGVYSNNDVDADLAFSRDFCDVVVITAAHSTFGWWLGFLSKGQVVYRVDVERTKDIAWVEGVFEPSDYFPPSWHKITPHGASFYLNESSVPKT